MSDFYDPLAAWSQPGLYDNAAYTPGMGFLEGTTEGGRQLTQLKSLLGLLFDSRLGYMTNVETGAPTFNFGGLEAGGGVEQFGTAEMGDQEVVDEYGNIIGYTAAAGGGGSTGGTGGSSGGGRRTSTTQPQGPNVLDLWANSNDPEFGDLFRDIATRMRSGTADPTLIKMSLANSEKLTPEQVTILSGAVDQAWEQQVATTAATAPNGTLPKGSDLATQVGKWGTVDPASAYTPDSLPQDVLGMLSSDYIPGVEAAQSASDEAMKAYMRYMKGNSDTFMAPVSELPLITRERALTDAGYRPDQPAAGTAAGRMSPSRNPNNPTAVTAAGREGPPPMLSPSRNPNNPIIEQSPVGPPALSPSRNPNNPGAVATPVGGGGATAAIVDAILTAANANRGANSPKYPRAGGQDLTWTVRDMPTADLNNGKQGWADNVFTGITGKPRTRTMMTNEAGYNAVTDQRNAQRINEQQTLGDRWLREQIANDLQRQGRTPQRDDLRGRLAQIRAMIGGTI